MAAATAAARPFAQAFFHGTRAALAPGAWIEVGHASNFTAGAALSWCYFSATLDAAIWGAELARGAGPGRIYVVEPSGAFEDDPNLTDKTFPGNPTQSYRSRAPLLVLGEVTGWQGHPPEQLRAMQEGLARLAAEGKARIIDEPPPQRRPLGARLKRGGGWAKGGHGTPCRLRH